MIIPCKASGWVNTLLTAAERDVLLKSGICPVNDKLLPYWGNKSKIKILYGGRGGGKSDDTAHNLINACITDPYFKCFYGRKTYESVRQSCFKTLVSEIERLGLKSEFSYSTSDHSTMIIRHIATDHEFIPFGCDKSEKLKSIKDPSHVWCEEFVGGDEEFTFKDFGDLLPTLRTEKADSQLILTLNTEGVPLSHWFIMVFFPELYTGEKQEGDIDISKELEGVGITKIFVNYTDNYFINHEQYRQQLWIASGGNKRLFESKANGAWGASDNKQPWLYAFDYEKHVSEKATYAPGRPVYLSFDFNNDPIACTAWQFCEPSPAHYAYVHCVSEFVGSFKIPELCQRIRTRFPNAIFYITGDRSGKNKQLQGHQTLYDIIGSLLNVNKRMINTPDFNLRHTDSRALCNMMFANYPKLSIHPSCITLINDCQIATIDPTPTDGNRLKKDREGYKMDAFDSMRYLMQTYFFDFVKKEYLSMAK